MIGRPQSVWQVRRAMSLCHTPAEGGDNRTMGIDRVIQTRSKLFPLIEGFRNDPYLLHAARHYFRQRHLRPSAKQVPL